METSVSKKISNGNSASMKLVFNKSGDEIELNSLNNKLSEYYVTQLENHNCNVFSAPEPPERILQMQHKASLLIEKINIVNDFLVKKLNIASLSLDGDVFDQNYLNTMHSRWVKLYHEFPKISILLRQVNLLQQYRDINSLIHAIESSFQFLYKNYTEDPWGTENIFGHNILKFGSSNIVIGFDNLGRSSYNKWVNFDDNFTDSCTNDYTLLSGNVHINLDRPYIQEPPLEYASTLKSKKLPIIGSKILLANMSNLQTNLKEYRHIFIRNICEQSSTISFRL